MTETQAAELIAVAHTIAKTAGSVCFAVWLIFWLKW